MKPANHATKIPLILLLLILVSTAGCQQRVKTVPAERILNLQPGLDRAKVEGIMAQAGQHQITASVDGWEFVVVTHAVDPWLPLLYIYRDGRLERVIKAPPDGDSLYSGVEWFKPDETDGEERLRAALAMPAVSNDIIRAEITRRNAEGENVTGTGLFLATIAAFTTPLNRTSTEEQDAVDKELAARFDPWKIQLGMPEGEVEKAFGAPFAVRDRPDGVIRAYGAHVPHGELRSPQFSWVAIQFENGRASRVFSHSAFDHSLLGAQQVGP